MKKHKPLKYFLTLLITFSLLSCESQVDKNNEKIQSLIYEKVLEINKNYLKCKSDIANSGLATLLSVNRLKEDKKNNLTESKLILKRLDSLNVNFNKTNQALISELKILFDSIKLSEKFNKEKLKIIQDKYEYGINVTKENFEIDSDIIDLSKKIINLLDQSCEFEIIDNQIKFYTQKCVNNYNFYNSHLESSISSAKMKIKMSEFEKNLNEN
ncbi:hypothetical protein [Confluentibacter flavum]|uniref:Lipoprotein n=1 Tax=Confluentibacter flavum TaxID=1909700 RepID=A0A2N3HPF9_9FLAO|nr:hypothetical protein [Confluentibacter flavum]PKQ46873.1 hypothetical protein CSW08_00750 [Confluentibacter flavum]